MDNIHYLSLHQYPFWKEVPPVVIFRYGRFTPLVETWTSTGMAMAMLRLFFNLLLTNVGKHRVEVLKYRKVYCNMAKHKNFNGSQIFIKEIFRIVSKS